MIQLDGSVKKPGSYTVDSHIKQNLDGLIQIAGGFSPLEEYKHEATSSVAWIERELPGNESQLIIIDYRNKQILLERRVEGGKWRLERYEWDFFEYQPSDTLFVTTSRQSLDLVDYPVQYVEDKGWKNFGKLRYFGKTLEETQAIYAAKLK